MRGELVVQIFNLYSFFSDYRASLSENPAAQWPEEIYLKGVFQSIFGTETLSAYRHQT